MGDQVWQVPQDPFVAVWNGSATLGAASARLKELTGAYILGRALMVRALDLRTNGVALKVIVRPVALNM